MDMEKITTAIIKAIMERNEFSRSHALHAHLYIMGLNY